MENKKITTELFNLEQENHQSKLIQGELLLYVGIFILIAFVAIIAR